jgi:hypothetical protein
MSMQEFEIFFRIADMSFGINSNGAVGTSKVVLSSTGTVQGNNCTTVIWTKLMLTVTRSPSIEYCENT